ncbi:hypothetical protein PGT21_027060 [Puccinia graminis f. sp. tritici]|uniref:Uncharacterized protein n=1 Tax=Puccinia graminis f. sp. tritici TaxID=56615 RepID=A0A5B0MDQ8_PUCGR|nr:hypothetical protein PGT21_027060 [Puccinia graminis f. sp. tritici]
MHLRRGREQGRIEGIYTPSGSIWVRIPVSSHLHLTAVRPVVDSLWRKIGIRKPKRKNLQALEPK